MLSGCFWLLSFCIPALDTVAENMDRAADIVACVVMACMSAQVDYELSFRRGVETAAEAAVDSINPFPLTTAQPMNRGDGDNDSTPLLKKKSVE